MSVWRQCVFVEHVFNVLVMGTLETCPTIWQQDHIAAICRFAVAFAVLIRRARWRQPPPPRTFTADQGADAAPFACFI